MNLFSLVLRNLKYYRLSNLAVAVGVAVATAVLVGALMVGDSVRNSLKTLAVQRLGPVDHALIGNRFFPESLAGRLAADPDFAKLHATVDAGIITRGGVKKEAASGSKSRIAATSAGVQIAALQGKLVSPGPEKCIINSELSTSLGGISTGEKLTFILPKLDDSQRDSTLARRGRGDVISDLTVQPSVESIASEPGFVSMFNPNGSQRISRNAWLNLSDLQDAVSQPKHANVLLVGHSVANAGIDLPTLSGAGVTSSLQNLLKLVMTLEDYGLTVVPQPLANPSARFAGADGIIISNDTYMPASVVTVIERAAKSKNIPLVKVSTNLINTVIDENQKKEIHYAIIAGLSDVMSLKADEIILNQYAADHLQAKIGDQIVLKYYQRNEHGEIIEVSTGQQSISIPLKVAGIIPLSGMAIDASLTPAFKGMTDSDSVRDWKAPPGIEIRKEWVTSDDEVYWKQYKAAPKLFVNFDTAKKMYGGTYGDVTSIRFPAEKSSELKAAVLDQLKPEDVGMVFQPIRAQQLEAANGSTDFAMLFIAFSFFLIISSLMLTAMLFRLSVEQRARQIGLLAALGFGPKELKRMLLLEGLLIAVVGSVVGSFIALGYTQLMILGLRTWWVDAIGTTAMRFHFVPMTLIIGIVASIMVAVPAILYGVRRVGRTPSATLLAGGWNLADSLVKSQRKWITVVGWFFVISALCGIAAGIFNKASAAVSFMAGGTMLLIGGLILISSRLRPQRSQSASGQSTSLSALILGYRNATRNPARSTLTLGLIAFATFSLVAVAALRNADAHHGDQLPAGAGGYRMMVSSDIPITGDLNTVAGRNILAFSDPENAIWNRLHFTPMRRHAQDDISCLNLNQPHNPTILSVPKEMIDAAGKTSSVVNTFSFSGAVEKVANPWSLLTKEPQSAAGNIPVITDAETAEYILKLGIGKTISVVDQSGQKRSLMLVATLAGSLFQGQLLMSEKNFNELYPSQSGASLLLVEGASSDETAAISVLSSELADFSVTIDKTTDILERYEKVKSTYMATFQVLGSLGLLLGTIGLAVVLLRGIIERKAELAMLAAIGFSRLDRLKMVLAENVLLLSLGLVIGVICALIAMLPVVTGATRHLHLLQLLGTLALVFIVALSVLILAVVFGSKNIRPSDMRIG